VLQVVGPTTGIEARVMGSTARLEKFSERIDHLSSGDLPLKRTAAISSFGLAVVERDGRFRTRRDEGYGWVDSVGEQIEGVEDDEGIEN
jgi:hypothetical protein